MQYKINLTQEKLAYVKPATTINPPYKRYTTTYKRATWIADNTSFALKESLKKKIAIKYSVLSIFIEDKRRIGHKKSTTLDGGRKLNLERNKIPSRKMLCNDSDFIFEFSIDTYSDANVSIIFIKTKKKNPN